ncbi:MAG: tetratricopeptide repeat protein, partial [Candidatus Zixiibacteriota bacterium]
YGMLLWLMGRILEADEQHRRAVELAPYSAEANRAYGHFLGYGIGKYEQGLEYLNKAVKLNPRDYRAYNSLSMTAALTGDFDRALWASGKAIEMSPNDPFPYRRRSYVLALAGMLDSAVVSYKECLAKFPHYEDALSGLGDVYTVLRKYEQADSVYALLAVHPDSVVRDGAWDYRTKTLRHQGRFREAMEQMEAVRREVEAGGGYANVSYRTRRRQGDLYISILDDPHSALIQVDSAAYVLDLLPIKTPLECATIEGFRAWAIAAMGDIQKGKTMLESFISKLDPSETNRLRTYNLFLAQVYRYAGEYDRACQFMERRLEYNPDFSARMYAGVSYLGAGRVGEAVSMLEAAVSTYDYNRFTYLDEAVLARYYLGQAYEAAGRKADAIKQYETFLDIWKNADEGLKSVEDAKQRLENLKQKI